MYLYIFRERSWIAIYTTEELEYAIEIGYELLAVYEAHNYSEKKKLFKDYIDALASLKIKVSFLAHPALTIIFYKVEVEVELIYPTTFYWHWKNLEGGRSKGKRAGNKFVGRFLLC